MSEEAINQINERLDETFYELIDELKQENQQLKERITYLENSNNRREEIIINLRHEQQLDKYKEVIEEVREVIKSEIPYLYEIDKEYEDVEGNTYFTYKEYDGSKLLQILDKAKEMSNE